MINFLKSGEWVNGSPIPENIFPMEDGRYSDSLSFLYSIFIFIGVIAVIASSIVCLRIKKIPLKEFINGIYISIPVAIIGASMFGKLGSTGEDWKIYRLFFFWEPGLSFFGGMLFGSSAAFIWFWHKKRTTKISIWVYADAIVPNVLIGQSIGRWGNLFNHEIMGKQVSDSQMNKITWLPEFIWHRLFYFRNPQTGEELTSLQFREPLFLYESIATFLFWIIIIFLIPNIWKLINKKPYNLDPYAFPCKRNKTAKWLVQEKLINYNTQIPIVYLKNKNNEFSMSMSWVWKKAFTLYEADNVKNKEFQKIIDTRKQEVIKAEKNYTKLKKDIKEKIKKLKLLNNYKDKIKELKKDTNFIQWRKNKSRIREFVGRNSKELYKINNPLDLKVLHCGAISSIYIIFISTLRILLDSFRDPYELSVKMLPVLNYLSLTGILIMGIILLIFSQFITPKKWRESGWLYEKSY
ncbi:prolipoprotein diacylglyceryl transferase [Spiroplasma turonicum]|uniref:Prolipoprotein diacylglyceryl transferase n=1 Tax=Spiroplasma turonicum TaxID=216946 RepID=A0A0K1P4U3_9MOLU|nr:prolipoprotein diacylglyceryl transferase family protein [Spiroplasma turonicum]AKU79311.1 prolipoprotein diacylglyceryl transferase [Spiroplasma turonicum]ALX70334.1 prolipoprotein diacylglyceryl transferase [Spiroplasma turonicum]